MMIADDRPIRAALALALTLGALALLYAQGVETAASVQRRVGYDPATRPDGVQVQGVSPGEPADRAGLRRDDRIVMIDGAPIRDLFSYGTASRHFQAGKPAVFRVVRGGKVVDLTVRPGMAFPLATFLFNALTALGFLAVALLALTQSLRDLRTRLLLGFSMAVAIELLLPSAVVQVIGLSWTKTLSNCAFYLLTGIEFSLELHLASLIPERPAWLRRRRWVVPLYYLVGVAFGILWCAIYLGDERGVHILPWTSGQADDWLNEFALPFWALAVSALLASQALRHPEPRGRQQAGLVLSATSAWFLFTLYTSILSLTGHPAPDWVAPLQTLVLLCFPVALFAAIFRYHLFDIELAVRRGLIYTTLSGALVLVFYGVLGAFGAEIGAGGRPRHAAARPALRPLAALHPPAHRPGLLPRAQRAAPAADRPGGRAAGVGQAAANGTAPRLAAHRDLRGALGAAAHRQPRERPAQRPGGDRRRLGGCRAVAAGATRRPGHRAAQARLPAGRGAAAGRPQLRDRPPAAGSRRGGAGGAAAHPGASHRGAGGRRPAGCLLTLLAHHVASVFENARLFESATYESLTGLLRREAILEQLDRELERAQRYDRPLTLAMADLDYFKEVNDRYGHLAGDTLLKAISQAASDGLRSTDWLGRYGGEEFLVVLPETDIAGAVSVAEKIRSLVQKTSVPMADGTLARVTISIGLASLRDDQPRQERLSARALIAAADRSLYEAKNSGRNRVYPLVA